MYRNIFISLKVISGINDVTCDQFVSFYQKHAFDTFITLILLYYFFYCILQVFVALYP